MTLLPVNAYQRGRACLVALLYGSLGRLEQSIGFLRLDLANLIIRGIRILVLTAVLSCCVEGSADRAGESVAGVADSGDVAPGVGRIGGVNTHGSAVNAADRLVWLGTFAAGIAKHEPIRGQRDGLANGFGGHAFG